MIRVVPYIHLHKMVPSVYFYIYNLLVCLEEYWNTLHSLHNYIIYIHLLSHLLKIQNIKLVLLYCCNTLVLGRSYIL